MAVNMLQNPFAKQAPAQQPIQQQQPNSQLQNQPLNNGANSNGSINDPNNTQNKNNNANVGDDPMMKFETLWQDPPVDPKNPIQPENPNFLPTIDPAKLQENFNKIDFSKYATPEETAAIIAGGEGASKAHMSILNKTMRQGMLTMFTASQRMVETGLAKAQERFLGKVPSHVKDVLVQGNLTKSSKLMSNPAYAPVIEATRKRFQERYPTATADQITTATESYIASLVKEASGTEEVKTPDNTQKLKQGSTDADWEEWIQPEINKSL